MDFYCTLNIYDSHILEHFTLTSSIRILYTSELGLQSVLSTGVLSKVLRFTRLTLIFDRLSTSTITVGNITL